MPSLPTDADALSDGDDLSRATDGAPDRTPDAANTLAADATPAPWPTDDTATGAAAGCTGALILADGSIFYGQGLGKIGAAAGEVCFNTAMTGYQEVLTDTSYADQIVTFTFPHIGNVGTNAEDLETVSPERSSGVRGCVLRADVTRPSNYRATSHLDDWLRSADIIAVAGIDTRALTVRIRETGLQNAVIVHSPTAGFDVADLRATLAAWPGIDGADLATPASTTDSFAWHGGPWAWRDDAGLQASAEPARHAPSDTQLHVVALDFGLKGNILRRLAAIGARVTVVPATTTLEDILALEPDGVFLSNGPGDPAATGARVLPTISKLIDSGTPMFGICLGHQMIALALGARTVKMHQGHHGANHPVHDFTTGKVEITSMNHGFAVDADSLPERAEVTHQSLFDGSNCGLRLKDRPVFSVQHHPEASPGPQDSHYLFERFAEAMRTAKAEREAGHRDG